MSEEQKKKEYNEHGKKYAPYITDMIMSHLSGVSDLEMANALERKVAAFTKKRTDVMKEFTLEQVGNVNFLLWEVTKLTLEKELLMERLSSVGIIVAEVEVSDKDIIERLMKNFNISKEDLKQFKDQKFNDYLEKYG